VDSITKKIVVQLAQSSTRADSTICSSDTIQIGIAPDGNPLSTYLWRPPYALSDPQIANPLASPDTTTSYVLFYNHDFCVDTFRQKIIVRFDSLRVSGGDVLCPKDTIRLIVSNTNNQSLVYSWQPTSEILSGANTASPIVIPTKDTAFTVIGTDGFGCKYYDTVRVKVASVLGSLTAIAEPDTILYGDTSQITATIPPQAVNFAWQNDSTLSALDILNPKAYPKETTTYKLEVSDGAGCSLLTDVTIVVLRTPCNREGVYIPNGFTPNSDGKNDTWFVRGNDIRKIEIAVYDRWGQKMFSTTDIKEGWDGTFKGKSLDPAVFGWYVEGECVSGDKFFLKGNLTLLR
jgi:gliding motility-associated-like protein